MNKTKVISGFIWRLLERFGAQAVSLIVSIVLARILDPSAYGTVTLITVFYVILQVFVDSGLGNALIQKKNADDLDFSSVFYFNLFVCGVLYLIIYVCAPVISLFYEDLSLTPLIRVISISILISGVANIQQAYVSRNMLFKRFFFASIVGTIVSGTIGICLAYSGFGVWSLVIQRVASLSINAFVLWITVKWRPQKQFSFARLKSLLSFGWKLLASTLLDTTYKNIRSLIIGKIYTEEDLAYYNQGNQYPDLIANNITTAIDSVLLPTMSQEQDNRGRVKTMMRRSIRISTYVMAPIMIGLAVCARPLISILLTDKWLGSVMFMQIFCITYIFYPIHTTNLNAIKAMGRSDLFLKLEIVKKIVGVASILITMWINVEAMAYSLLVTTLLGTVINAFPNQKLLEYNWFEQMKDILPNLGLAVLMGVPVYFLQYLPLSNIKVLGLQVISGIGIYIGLSILFKLEIFEYLLNILKGFMNKRSKT